MAVYEINRIAVSDAPPDEPGLRAKTLELRVSLG